MRPTHAAILKLGIPFILHLTMSHNFCTKLTKTIMSPWRWIEGSFFVVIVWFPERIV